MITPRIKPSGVAPTDLYVQGQRHAKFGGFIAGLAPMDGRIDFAAIAAQVDAACPRPDRLRGGRRPSPPRALTSLKTQLGEERYNKHGPMSHFDSWGRKSKAI